MYVKHSTYKTPVCHTADGDSVFFGQEVPYHAEVSEKVGRKLIEQDDIEKVDSLPEAPSDLAALPMTDSKDGATDRKGRKYQENVAPRRDNRNK